MTPRWSPTAGASSGQVRRRRGCGCDRTRATVRAMDDEVGQPAQPDDGGAGLDLLTVGLFVFFVALIVTVGSLLLVQAVF